MVDLPAIVRFFLFCLRERKKNAIQLLHRLFKIEKEEKKKERNKQTTQNCDDNYVVAGIN